MAAKAVVEVVANTEEVMDILKLKGHIKITMLVVNLLIVDHHVQQVKFVIELGSRQSIVIIGWIMRTRGVTP